MLARRHVHRALAVVFTATVALFVVIGPTPAGAATGLTPVSGLLPGATATRTWDFGSAQAGRVLHVNLLANGATNAADCVLEVTRTWVTGQSFSVEIKNTGTIACGGDVIVSAVDPLRTWSTGALNAGAARSWRWNNANPLTSVYFAGLSAPSGCSLQVTRTGYRQQPGGEREFYLTVRNIGSSACTGDVLLARTSATGDFDGSPRSFPVGATLGFGTGRTPRPSPSTFQPVVFAASPRDASADLPCQIEITRPTFTQTRLGAGPAENPGGITSWAYLKNTGQIACSAVVLYTQLP